MRIPRRLDEVPSLADAVGLDRDARECHLEAVEWTSHGLPRLAHDAVDRNDDRFARRGAETHVPVPERILNVDDVRPKPESAVHPVMLAARRRR